MNYRHGDVLIKKIDTLPKDLKKVSSGKKNVLAYGEVTGHSHDLVSTSIVSVLEDTGGNRYFVLESGGEITHQEHGTKPIPAGTYVIGSERERDPYNEGIRKVAD